MASDNKQRFSVIVNNSEKTKQEEERKREKDKRVTSPIDSFRTDPLLREKLMRYTNNEGGRRFTVEDWLKW